MATYTQLKGGIRMLKVQPVKVVQSSAKEIASWFNTERAVVTAYVALAASGLGGLAVWGIVTDNQDEKAAVPLIRKDGFHVSQDNVIETMDGGVINITSMKAGHCAVIGDVTADLTFHDGKVVDVSDYRIAIGDKALTVVQNASQLHQLAPGDLHC